MWIRKQHLLQQGQTILPGWSTKPKTTNTTTANNGVNSFGFAETQAALDDIAAQPPPTNSGQSVAASAPGGYYSDDDDYADDGFDDNLEVYYDGDFNEEPDSPPPPTLSRPIGGGVHNTSSQSWGGGWEPNPTPPNPPPGFHNTPPVAQATATSMYSPNQTCTTEDVDYQRQIVGENGVPIQVEALAEGIFANVEVFFVCAACGKVFWEGRHFERILAQFESILVDGTDRQGRYHHAVKS